MSSGYGLEIAKITTQDIWFRNTLLVIDFSL